MTIATTPNKRDAKACHTCAWALNICYIDGNAWCSHEVPRDPREWPSWVDREEDLSYNRVDLCESVSLYEVCDAWAAPAPSPGRVQ